MNQRLSKPMIISSARLGGLIHNKCSVVNISGGLIWAWLGTMYFPLVYLRSRNHDDRSHASYPLDLIHVGEIDMKHLWWVVVDRRGGVHVVYCFLQAPLFAVWLCVGSVYSWNVFVGVHFIAQVFFSQGCLQELLLVLLLLLLLLLLLHPLPWRRLRCIGRASRRHAPRSEC